MARSPCFSCWSIAKVEMIGVWLKAKTITGMEIQTWWSVCELNCIWLVRCSGCQSRIK